MRVIIIGGGKVGSNLAHTLLHSGYQVGLIEHRVNVLTHLHRELPTEVIFDGDGARCHVLEHAGIAQCDALVAVTGDDAINLFVAALSKQVYHVPRVIARINNPKNAWLFTPEMDVDAALNQADLLVQLITACMADRIV